jgi:ABC-type uncharacterized transport system permease subunit
MSRITLADRIASAFVGAVVGVLVGLVLAWLLGVYSNTLGPSQLVFGVPSFVLKVSATFALLGLVLGSHVGTLLGNVISLIFAFETLERRDDVELPRWFVLVVLGLVILGVWWFMRE